MFHENRKISFLKAEFKSENYIWIISKSSNKLLSRECKHDLQKAKETSPFVSHAVHQQSFLATINSKKNENITFCDTFYEMS